MSRKYSAPFEESQNFFCSLSLYPTASMYRIFADLHLLAYPRCHIQPIKVRVGVLLGVRSDDEL